MNPPSAVLRPFSANIAVTAGPACRDFLQMYKDEDVHNLFHEVTEQSYEILIPIVTLLQELC